MTTTLKGLEGKTISRIEIQGEYDPVSGSDATIVVLTFSDSTIAQLRLVPQGETFNQITYADPSGSIRKWAQGS